MKNRANRQAAARRKAFLPKGAVPVCLAGAHLGRRRRCAGLPPPGGELFDRYILREKMSVRHALRQGAHALFFCRPPPGGAVRGPFPRCDTGCGPPFAGAPPGLDRERDLFMKRKPWVLAVAAVFAIVLVITSMNTPGAVDPAEYTPAVYSTALALLPPVIAIVLALITKEVYSSLFVGIIAGALLYANGNVELAVNTLFFNEDGGMIYKLADSWNVGILVFLVVLGILVALMNKVGGSAAFGQWASTHIKTRVGAQLATMLRGVRIGVDA